MRFGSIIDKVYSSRASPIDDPYTNPQSSPAQDNNTSVLERPSYQEPGDQDKFSHYVRKEDIIESALTGAPVIALCGKVWTPGRDPQKFPVCPECQEIYDTMKSE